MTNSCKLNNHCLLNKLFSCDSYCTNTYCSLYYFNISGGTVFTITGQDLNTVQEPQLLIYLPKSSQPIASSVSNCVS